MSSLGLAGRRGLLLVGAAISLLGCPPAPSPPSPRAPAADLCTPHSVILVRHAEKVTADPQDRDPELTPKGRERAAHLATMLGKTAITRLVASEYKRTQLTLAPLAERTQKPVEVRSASKTSDLVRELRDAPPGSTTIVATHSNVIPMIVRELGGGPLRAVGADGNLPDDEYSRVLVLSLGCSAAASVVELSSD